MALSREYHYSVGRMTEVRIRNVEEWVVEWHRQSAKRAGQTLESSLRELLTGAALARKRSIAEEMRTDLNQLRAAHGTFPDSSASIRQERERRG
jgi:plasmid stability protein